MAENSKIEWTNHTFNPWRGCTKIAAGCTNCYAEKLSHRNPKTLGVWGDKGTRVVAAESAWKEPLKWDRLAEKAGERHRVFCASLADVFEDWKGRMLSASGKEIWEKRNNSFGWEESEDTPDYAYDHVPIYMDEVRHRLFGLILQTPNLDWLLLTKRPENLQHMVPWMIAPQVTGVPGTVWPNIWLGTSISTQDDADRNIPELLKIPAKVRFLSVEPMLEGIELERWLIPKSECNKCVDECCCPGIDWIIFGGESGPKARPCNIEWIRDGLSQCRGAGVPAFVKQLGSDPVYSERTTDMTATFVLRGIKNPKGGDPSEWPADLRIQEFPQ